jgi:Ca2+-binding RTX toxin-like protein
LESAAWALRTWSVRQVQLAALLALATGALLIGVGRVEHSSSTASLGVAPTQAQSLDRLPLAFSAVPSADKRAPRFFAGGPGYGIEFTPEGARLSVAGTRRGAQPLTLSLQLGTSAETRLVGRQPASTDVNYLLGGRARAPGQQSFAQVRYQDAWPGVDASFRGTGESLRYDLFVRPGASVEDIAIRVAGATNARVARDGALVLGTRSGALRMTPPAAYQWNDGRFDAVRSRFTVDHRGGIATVGFTMGRYDRTQPLVIDPTIVFSSLLGAVNFYSRSHVAVGPDGSAYLTGMTWFNDFPATPGALKEQSEPGFNGEIFADAFVAKIDPTASRIVWATYLGGNYQNDNGRDLVADPDGSLFVAGRTDSDDFPTSLGAYDRSFNSTGSAKLDGEGDAFVVHLNAAGNEILASTYIGGKTRDTVFALARKGDDVYVAGETESSNFPVTPGAFDETYDTTVGTNDMFVAKLPEDLSALSYSTFLGGNGDDYLWDLAVDPAGSAYVVGSSSASFPTTPGAFETNGDGFVTKLDPTGSSLAYSTRFGGSSVAGVQSIFVEADGSATVAGGTTSSDFATTPGANRTTFEPVDGVDHFVSRLDPTGSSLVFSTFARGGSFLSEDADGNIYVAEPRLQKFDSTGSTLLSDSQTETEVTGMAVDPTGVVYVTGPAPEESSTRVLPRVAGLRPSFSGDGAVLREMTTACTIQGTSGDDTLTGTSGRDVICGGVGNDQIVGFGGSDIVFGGAGVDSLSGGLGADALIGGSGNDALHGGDGRDLLLGNSGADLLLGESGSDMLLGFSGLDRLLGGADDDEMYGGVDPDALRGGGGGDTLHGGAGTDGLQGQDGNDRLYGGGAADRCRGGTGFDVLRSCER